MPKTIEQIFESRKKADNFHYLWESWHEKVDKRINNIYTYISFVLGLLITWLLFNIIHKLILEYNLPWWLIFIVFAFICLFISIALTGEGSEAWKWADKQDEKFKLEKLAKNLGKSHETELKDIIKGIKPYSSYGKAYFYYSEPSNRLVFYMAERNFASFILWLCAMIPSIIMIFALKN